MPHPPDLRRMPLALRTLASSLTSTPYAGLSAPGRQRIAAVLAMLADNLCATEETGHRNIAGRDAARLALGAVHAAALTYESIPIDAEQERDLVAHFDAIARVQALFPNG